MCVVAPGHRSDAQPSWTPIGPAPTVNGECAGSPCTDYLDDASGRIVGIAAHPGNANIIYLAAAGGGVWKTGDGGATWIPSTDTEITLFMGAIALAPRQPDVIYAGTGEANMGPSKERDARDNIYYGRGVLKSTDAGSTWRLLGAAEFDRRTISKIVVHPTDPDTVYVAIGALATNGLAHNTGIWKSRDGGATWVNMTAPNISDVSAFSDLVMDPTDPETIYAAVGEPGVDPDRPRTDNGVWKTTNGGNSWARAGNFPTGTNSQVGRIALAISPSDPQTLYGSIARPGPPNSTFNSLYQIRKTTNGGLTWAIIADINNPGRICPEGNTLDNYLGVAGDYHTTLAVDPSDPGIVYAGGLCLIRGTQNADGTYTWLAIATGATVGPHRDHHALAFDGNGKLLDGNDGGIWRLDADWTNLNGNLQVTQFVGLARHPQDATIAYGGTQDTGTVKFQNSSRWGRLLRGDGGASVVSPTNPDRVYQITRISPTSADIFRRSDDAGVTWTPKVRGIDPLDAKNFYPPVAMDASNSDHLLLGTTRVYETTNGGDTWTPIGTPGANGWTVDANVDSLAVAPPDPLTNLNAVYASAGGHILVTFDSGATWQLRDIPAAGDHFKALVVDPTNPAIGYAARDRFDMADARGHLFRTVDGGQSWIDISGDLPDLPVYCIAVDRRVVPNVLYVGTDSGVFASTDPGGHWTRSGTGLPNVQVTALTLDTTMNVLTAATHGRGVWEIPLQ